MLDLDPALRSALAGRYEIEREIGQGAFAKVYVAADLRHNRQVAIKVVTIDPTTEEPELRFLREIRLLAHLQHPNILPLHDSGHVGGLLYYVMPYVRGQSLREKISQERRLAVAEAVALTLEVADALHYAHRAGVIHRDIKPENILISGGHAIIADFGVAGLVAPIAGGRLTRPEQGSPGTPSYMSPEQLMGSSEPDARSDVYSLTCVLYEMLAGKPPFAGKQGFVQRFTESPLISRVRPDVAPPLERVIARALERNPDDRFSDARQFAHALRSAVTGAEQVSVPPAVLAEEPKRRVSWPVVTIPLVAVAAIAAAVALVRSRSAVAPSRYLVAVAPFAVLDSSLALWREGLMDILSRNIDGAGPLRSVPASEVARRWVGTGDAASALQLAERTGAGTVVFGHLLRSGQDSVRVITSVFDARANRVLAQLETGNVIDRMDLVSDSLTFDLIRELDATLSIGAGRQTHLRVPASLEALRAFLQGEQLFRRSHWDSARVYYERVIARDSTFALAYRRLGLILGWLRTSSDREAQAMRLRAGALNRGLGPRDSVLLLADSLSAAATAATFVDEWPLSRRLLATLTDAVRRYAHDAEMWFELGEARFHFGTGPVRSQSWRATLDAFDQAIALDSGLGPAYAHTPEVALEVSGAPLALQYVKASLRQDPEGPEYDKMRLLELVFVGAPLRSAELREILDRLPADVAHSTRQTLQRWPDTAETAVELSRLLFDKKFSPLTPLMSDDVYLAELLAGQLAFRGHIQEAAAKAPILRNWLVFELAYVGGGEPVESRLNELVRAGVLSARFAPYWWASRGDTAALHAYLDRARIQTKSADEAVKRVRAIYDTSAAIAYLAVARGDSTEALERFVALPDTLCLECSPDRFARARLLARTGNYRGAMTDLTERLTRRQSPLLVLMALERARVAERLGDPEGAARNYQFVVDAWAKADAHLQVYVREARVALQRLKSQ